MKDNIKVMIYFTIFIVFMILATVGYNKLSKMKSKEILESYESQEVINNKKTKLPDFELYLENGDKISSKDLIGKPLVINVWTSWCGYCDIEMPYFNELYLKEKNNITFVMINVTGDRDSKEAAKKYITQRGYSFNIYYDLYLDAISSLDILSYPTTIFVDSDGYIESTIIGMITKETLQNKINKLK